MFSYISTINWLSVIVASVASFVLGGIWFAALFSKQYGRALGRENQPAARPTPLFLAGPFVCGLVTAATTAIVMNALQLKSLGEALSYGGVVGFGYLAATTVNTAINPNIPRPLLYGLVSGSFFFLSSLIVSVIIVAMR